MKTVVKFCVTAIALCLMTGVLTGCAASKNVDVPTGARDFIVGKIADCDKFVNAHPRFARAFAFMKRPDLATLPVRRYEIDGDDMWAMIMDATLVPFGDEQTTEVHGNFIDIQAPLTGAETIGFLTLTPEERAALAFNAKKDIGLFKARTKPVTLRPGDFAVFMPPCGAHAPGCSLDGERTIRKLVIKIRK